MSNITQGPLGGSDNAWAYFDSSVVNTRVLDAFGPAVSKFRLRKPDNFVTAHAYTTTAVNSSTCVNDTTAGGGMLITTDTAEYDGINIQAIGTVFDLAADKPIYFGAKLAVSDATQSDLLVGLAGTDTALITAGAHTMGIGAGFVGFYKLDAVTQTYFATYQTTSANNVAAASTLDTDAHWYEFEWDGSALYGYVDGDLVATFTDDLPTVALTPSICFRAGAAAAKTCSVSDWYCYQVRD